MLRHCNTINTMDTRDTKPLAEDFDYDQPPPQHPRAATPQALPNMFPQQHTMYGTSNTNVVIAHPAATAYIYHQQGIYMKLFISYGYFLTVYVIRQFIHQYVFLF